MSACSFLGLFATLLVPTVAFAQHPNSRRSEPPRFVPPVHAKPIQSVRRPIRLPNRQAVTRQVMYHEAVPQENSVLQDGAFTGQAGHKQQNSETFQPPSRPNAMTETDQSRRNFEPPPSFDGGWQKANSTQPAISAPAQLAAPAAAPPSHYQPNSVPVVPPSQQTLPTAQQPQATTFADQQQWRPAKKTMTARTPMRDDSRQIQEVQPRQDYSESAPQNGFDDGASVLVNPGQQSTPSVSNQMSNRLRMEPRRIQNAQLRNRRAARPKNAYYQEGLQDLDQVPVPEKTCEEFRQELLDDPISNIVLDNSPYPPDQQEIPAEGLTRTWTDCIGNELGTGTLVGLRRSYIVITDEAGNESLIERSQLSDADLEIVTQYWGLPTECTLGCDQFEGRTWTASTFHWKASALCHKPLYFENIQLERYGHSNGPVLEPVRSTAHFFVSLISWPYQAGIHPSNECVYALGYFRPGNCAPWLREPVPISLAGAVYQAAAVTGAAAIIP